MARVEGSGNIGENGDAAIQAYIGAERNAPRLAGFENLMFKNVPSPGE
jgi:hypothetical protein